MKENQKAFKFYKFKKNPFYVLKDKSIEEKK